MTWAALSAEIAVEMRGYAEHERASVDAAEWLSAYHVSAHADQRETARAEKMARDPEYAARRRAQIAAAGRRLRARRAAAGGAA